MDRNDRRRTLAFAAFLLVATISKKGEVGVGKAGVDMATSRVGGDGGSREASE